MKDINYLMRQRAREGGVENYAVAYWRAGKTYRRAVQLVAQFNDAYGSRDGKEQGVTSELDVNIIQEQENTLLVANIWRVRARTVARQVVAIRIGDIVIPSAELAEWRSA
jgi:hypothetical protein